MSETTKYKLTNKVTGEEAVATPAEFGEDYVVMVTESGVRHNFDNPNKSGDLTNGDWEIEEVKAKDKKPEAPAK